MGPTCTHPACSCGPGMCVHNQELPAEHACEQGARSCRLPKATSAGTNASVVAMAVLARVGLLVSLQAQACVFVCAWMGQRRVLCGLARSRRWVDGMHPGWELLTTYPMNSATPAEKPGKKCCLLKRSRGWWRHASYRSHWKPMDLGAVPDMTSHLRQPQLRAGWR